jgi:uncharacterized RDD family membrane protein YckC
MSGNNPYAPPKADLDAGPGLGAPELLPTAGLGARFLNFLIDGIVARIVVVSVAGVLAAFLRSSSPDVDGSTAIVVAVIGFVAFLGYYAVLEAAFGWTIGKLITGTRVVRFDGGKPRVAQIIGRTFARFIPFEPFSVLGSSNQGWHDSLSGTRVVRVRR